MNNTDRTLYTLLLILSFGLPILLGLWVAWKRKMIPGLKATDPETDEEGYQTKKEFKCDDNGCHLAKVTRVRPGEKENYLYQ